MEQKNKRKYLYIRLIKRIALVTVTGAVFLTLSLWWWPKYVLMEIEKETLANNSQLLTSIVDTQIKETADTLTFIQSMGNRLSSVLPNGWKKYVLNYNSTVQLFSLLWDVLFITKVLIILQT